MIGALDVESTGLTPFHGCRPFLVSILQEDGKFILWRWRVNPFSREVDIPNSEKLQVYDALSKLSLISFWNAKFDIRMLDMSGIPLPKNLWEITHDGIIQSHCIQSSGPHGLKDRALTDLDILDDDQKELRRACIKARTIAKSLGWRIAEPEDPHWPTTKTGSFWEADMWIPAELVMRRDAGEIEDERIEDGWLTVCEDYNKRDDERTLGLHFTQYHRLQRSGLLEQYEIRRKNLQATYEMSARGITLRRSKTTEVKEKHSHLAKVHYNECLKVVRHQVDNLESPKQLQAAMFNILGMPVLHRTEKSNQPSTDKDTIAELRKVVRPNSKAGWFLKHLLAYRKRSHAADTVESWEKGCIPFQEGYAQLHWDLNITGAATTRSSMSNQNIAKGEGLPKEERFNLRDLFGPRPGYLWYDHDYSNIELRIFSMLADEKEWLEAFEKGYSVHLIVAELLYPEIFDEDFKAKYPHLYQWVKNGNFSLTYGAGQKTADATYHVPGAYKLIRKRFKQVDRFMDVCIAEAKQYGYVTTLGGYRLEVPRDRLYTTAVDYKVQGSAGFAMNIAKNRTTDYCRGLKNHFCILEYHDELLHEVPRVHSPKFPWEIKRLMEMSGNDLGLPLPVEMSLIRTSWDSDEEVPAYVPTTSA